eukprot:378479_1
MATMERLADTDDDNIQTSLGVQAEAQKRKKYIYGGVALLLTVILIIVIIVATTSGGGSGSSNAHTWPIVVATWDKKTAADAAYNSMTTSQTNYKSLDGIYHLFVQGYNNITIPDVVAGVQWCQSNCNVNQNTGVKAAMVIWGPKMETGAVANLYDIDDVVGVAKHVLIYTQHAMIIGEAATHFGFKRKNLHNNTQAAQKYATWKAGTLINGTYELDTESSVHDITGCDANETGVIPPMKYPQTENNANVEGGMVTGSVAIIGIDENGEMALATSSNGLNAKIAGRVSDAAIPGAGGYIDPNVGGCTATGHGDIIIRFAPAKTAVTFMKQGSTPQEAAQLAIDEIVEWCGDKQAIVLCIDKNGVPGIANNEATGKPKFAYRSRKCTAAVSADVDNPRGDCK